MSNTVRGSKGSTSVRSRSLTKTRILLVCCFVSWLCFYVIHQSSLINQQKFSDDELQKIIVSIPRLGLAKYSGEIRVGSSNAEKVEVLAHQRRDRRRSNTTIDIISVGSHARPLYQETQKNIFGNYSSVRNFFGLTEDDDTEMDCHKRLSSTHLQKVVKFCRGRGNVLGEKLFHFRQMTMHYATLRWLKKKSNPIGWLCAQKRPFDGLMKTLGSYKSQDTPDYLIVVDDDTWVNIDQLVSSLRSMYPAELPYAIAGCMIRSRVHEHNFTIPYGGWGMIFSRPAIENLMKPLYCNTAPNNFEDEFVRLACWRLSESPIGEQPLFREGMSVAQLMHAYVNDQPYQQVDSWNSLGYCLHSDWVWGYFTNFYHISVHTNTPKFSSLLEDRLQGFNGSMIYAGRPTPETEELKRECRNQGDDMCTKNSNMCHYVTPQHMERLTLQLQGQ